MKKLILLSILLIFSCDNNEDEISDLKDTVEDLKQQIVELQNTQLTTQTNNQNQITELVEKVASLEVDSAKYDSDVVGCYREFVIGHTMKIYPNGVGVVDFYESRIDQVFTWEVNGDFIQFNFGEKIWDCYVPSDSGLSYLFSGTQLATYTPVSEQSNANPFDLSGLQVLKGENIPECENIDIINLGYLRCEGTFYDS